MIIDLRKSKTDQESSGRKVGIPFGRDRKTCPVRPVQRWLKRARVSSGPLFRPVNRHGHAHRDRALHKDLVGAILKTAARRAHMKTKPLAGHSLRAGCVTQAAMNGVNKRDIMRQSGHKSTAMLAKYVRISQMFTHNAAAGSGSSPGLTTEKFGFSGVGESPIRPQGPGISYSRAVAAPSDGRRAIRRLHLSRAVRRIVLQITARTRASRKKPEYAENAQLRPVDTV